MRTAMNEQLRDDYIEDCAKGVERWNKIIRKTGIDFELRLPHKRFHRQIGTFATAFIDMDGNPISEEAWNQNKGKWLPTDEDEIYVKSLMQPCTEPGKIANWLAPPRKGINSRPAEFEYVRRPS